MRISGEIKWHIENDYAHLKYDENDDAIRIHTVFVPAAHRNQGIGSQLLLRVLTMADRVGKCVVLDARPIGATGENHLRRLIHYYSRFDFTVISRGNCKAVMKRLPIGTRSDDGSVRCN